MDDADFVVMRSEREISLALRSFPAKPLAVALARQCSLCGDDIPVARLAALSEWGCDTCAGCQDKLERGMGR